MSSANRFEIALSFTKGVTAEFVRYMEQCGVSAEELFTSDVSTLSQRLKLNIEKIPRKADRDQALFRACDELKFIEKNGIKALYLLSDKYPHRLRECIDAPIVLYSLGDADLDASRMMSVVGTRRPTGLGYSFCHKLVEDVHAFALDVTVVSGLALGVDTCAHTSTLESHGTTIAVLAHGLHTIYPSANRDLARKIIKEGGAVVTQYPSNTPPYRPHFLERNRIIAGLSDLTVVIESEIKGGAMSTASLAFNYNREVMAVPGRPSDQMSGGCNHLIRTNKASLLSGAVDIVELMGWTPPSTVVNIKQRNLFPDLTPQEREVYDYLRYAQREVSIDELHEKVAMQMGALISLLADMEYNNILVKLPGNRYALTI